MGDADRRAAELEVQRLLEGEGRYGENLAALLACLREGHVPTELPSDPPVHGATIQKPVVNFVRMDYGFAGRRIWVRLCSRCRSPYWGEEKIPVEPPAPAPLQVVFDPGGPA